MRSLNSPNRVEHVLLTIICVLTAYSLLAIYAASALKAVELYNDPEFFLKKQFFAVLVGYAIMFLLYYLPYHFISRLTLPLLFLSILLLSLILIPGAYSKVGGAYRWLNLAGLRIQPGEIAKIALVFFLAKNLDRPQSNINQFWQGLFPNIFIFTVFFTLLLLQPDFGTAVLLSVTFFLMLFAGGISKKHILGFMSCGILLFISAIVSAPYRIKRILSFLDPWSRIQSEGFQIVQSFLAFRNGGLWGVGLGSSKQKLFYLPEAHTDFILSVIAEESGFIGTVFIIFSFLIITLCGFKITRQLKNRHQKFLAFGLCCILTLQVLFNISVIMGILPTKGITLPFLSSGLSSLLVFFFITGVLARLGKESQKTTVLHEKKNNLKNLTH